MPRKPLKGVFPLMPFVVKSNQELDLDGLKSNIRAYEDAGFNGYIAFGCMGEFYAPSDEEFKKVVDTAVDTTKKIACVFGTTFHNTAECIRRTKYVENAGGDGVMIGPPYLIPCTSEAAYEHYRQVNDAVDDVQIMAYNNPGSFRFNMTPEFWDKLMELDRVKAVKESNGEVIHRTRVVSHISKRINVFAGGENWLLADSLVGGNSIVSVVGPGTPKGALAFFNACMKRDLDRAISFHVKFTGLFRNITSENEVAWLKACAELGGFKAGPPRAPYAQLDQTIRKSLEVELRELTMMAEQKVAVAK
jgi:dihydrodipicolinate synthase/N-acetylneuraminate lyase